VRPLRALLLFDLGVWAGMLGAAAVAKRALPSRGDAESDELGLVAILDGIELESRATAFTGGSMLAWFGGIDVDLSEARLAPGAQLTLNTLFGGIAIKAPPGCRLESELKAVAGGVDARSTVQDDPAAPVLTLTGTAVFGGISVKAKAADASAEADEDD
jgi:hypothetical protein